jgi:hypothetical protein
MIADKSIFPGDKRYGDIEAIRGQEKFILYSKVIQIKK